MKKYMRGINELQKCGKKVCAGAARWGVRLGGIYYCAGVARGWRGGGRGGCWRQVLAGAGAGAGVGPFGVNPGGVWKLSSRGV